MEAILGSAALYVLLQWQQLHKWGARLRARQRWARVRSALRGVSVIHYLRANKWAGAPNQWGDRDNYPGKIMHYLRPTESGRPLNLIDMLGDAFDR